MLSVALVRSVAAAAAAATLIAAFEDALTAVHEWIEWDD
jgi:hypothetical protein